MAISHDQFDRTNKRGAQKQADQNPNKAQYLATFLNLHGVESMDDLTSEQLITLNVNISKVDAEPLADPEANNSIGLMIEIDKEKGSYYGQD